MSDTDWQPADEEHRTHLPECGWDGKEFARCICPQLRAAEQRLLTDTGLINEIRNEQFVKGVKVARDAVENVPMPDVLPPTVWAAWVAGNAASLTAIDKVTP